MPFRVRTAGWNEMWNSLLDARRVLRDWRKFLPMINLFLMALALFLSGMTVYRCVVSDGYDLGSARGSSRNAPEPLPEIVPRSDDPSAFSVVSLRNIFNPERKEWETKRKDKASEKKAKEVAALSPMIKKLTVYGVAIVGAERKVLLNDLEKGKKKGRFRYVSEGDTVLGCRVKRIEEGRLILECRGEEIVKTIQNRERRQDAYIITGFQPSSRSGSPEKGEGITRAGTDRDDRSGMRREGEPKGKEPQGKAGEKVEKKDEMEKIKKLMDLMKSLEKK